MKNEMRRECIKEVIKMYQVNIDKRKKDIKKLEEEIAKIKQQNKIEEKIKKELENQLNK